MIAVQPSRLASAGRHRNRGNEAPACVTEKAHSNLRSNLEDHATVPWIGNTGLGDAPAACGAVDISARIPYQTSIGTHAIKIVTEVVQDGFGPAGSRRAQLEGNT